MQASKQNGVEEKQWLSIENATSF